jgi:hypothetical protein
MDRDQRGVVLSLRQYRRLPPQEAVVAMAVVAMAMAVVAPMQAQQTGLGPALLLELLSQGSLSQGESVPLFSSS